MAKRLKYYIWRVSDGYYLKTVYPLGMTNVKSERLVYTNKKKANKFQNTITFGQLLGVGITILGAIIIFVVMVNVRLSNLENNQTGLKDSYREFNNKLDKFIDVYNSKTDKFTTDLNDIKILLHDKVDKK